MFDFVVGSDKEIKMLRAEIARLQEQYRAAIKDAQESIAANMRLRAALEDALTALATTGEDGCRQVLRAAIAKQEGRP
jgi:transcriptional/translational regulatory protein YebC/TACO1